MRLAKTALVVSNSAVFRSLRSSALPNACRSMLAKSKYYRKSFHTACGECKSVLFDFLAFMALSLINFRHQGRSKEVHVNPITCAAHELAKLSSLFSAFRKCLKLQN